MPNTPYASAIQRTLSDKLGEMPSVLDFGADRTGATDSAAAINTAIASVAAATGSGGAVLIPPGVYIVDEPIIMASGVALISQHRAPRYAQDPTQPNQRAVIKASAAFPAGGVAIDCRGLRSTTLSGIDIVGDGGETLTQIDATCTGIAYGTAGLSDGADYPLHQLDDVSVVNCKRGVWSKQGGYQKWRNVNVGSNWYCGVDFEKYVGDFVLMGCQINSNNWAATGLTDRLNDQFPGVGIRLGYGCQGQIIGGKIEWNSVGVWMEQCIGVRLIGVTFDANKRWSGRIVSAGQHDDLQTIDNIFDSCYFLGGSYDTGLSGYDAHVLIDLEKTPFFPTTTRVTFSGCIAKATYAGAAYSISEQYPKYPKNNAIATRILGAGSGSPRLDLSINGGDWTFSSVKSGTCTTAGTNVARVTGDAFEAGIGWVGRIFGHYYYNPYTVESVSNGDAMTLTTDAGTNAEQPWHVETNKILIADVVSYSNIEINAVGLDHYSRRDVANQRNLINIYGSDGSVIATLSKNAALTLDNNITVSGVRCPGDRYAVHYFGRYDGAVDAAVIDFAEPPGGAVPGPAKASFRLGGNEKIKLSQYGIRVGGLGVGRDPATTTFQVDVDGATKLRGGLMMTNLAGGSPIKIDGDKWLYQGKIKLDDASEIQASAFAAGHYLKWDGTKCSDGGVPVLIAAPVDWGIPVWSASGGEWATIAGEPGISVGEPFVQSVSVAETGPMPAAVDVSGMSGADLTIATALNDLLTALGSGNVIKAVAVANKTLDINSGIITDITRPA